MEATDREALRTAARSIAKSENLIGATGRKGQFGCDGMGGLLGIVEGFEVAGG